MYNHVIYIAEENTEDMFNTQIPQFNTESALPAIPIMEVQPEQKDEDQFVSKSFQSFSITLVIIILILVIAMAIIFIKNRRSESYGYIPEDENVSNLMEHSNIDNNVTDNNTEQVRIQQATQEISVVAKERKKKKLNSSLNTPPTITKCIRKFLENTKEN